MNGPRRKVRRTLMRGSYTSSHAMPMPMTWTQSVTPVMQAIEFERKMMNLMNAPSNTHRRNPPGEDNWVGFGKSKFILRSKSAGSWNRRTHGSFSSNLIAAHPSAGPWRERPTFWKRLGSFPFVRPRVVSRGLVPIASCYATGSGDLLIEGVRRSGLQVAHIVVACQIGWFRASMD